MRLQNKVALITGGARGQGATEARQFVAEGAELMITDVLDGEGQALAAELGEAVVYRHQDVTDEAGWAATVGAAVERWGRLDVLVNNAGILKILPMTETSLDDFESVMGVNSTGVFLGMKAVADVMKAQGSGSIVNISSVAGLRGVGSQFAYAASKWAVRGMSRSAAVELAPHDIRVNSVHPGIIDTPMLDHYDDANRARVQALIPLGRETGPDAVAELVTWLASDASSYCTAGEFIIDGGMSA
ncbi:MAG: glucose 1-dehydrogenase [Actinomycetia bacterium]|nr:glucose 1-dehydrogenase [Actinomycetes bacterium]MCP4086247.1 glucose 1-dehydrogenase [Actinomycetes bacterium]